MALRISVSTVACAMVGMALIGSVLKGGGDGSDARPKTIGAAAPTDRPTTAAQVRTPSSTSPGQIAADPVARPEVTAAGIDDSLPTGSVDLGSGLHTPNPAAYGDAAREGSSLVLTGAEAINYLAGNTLRRGRPGEAPHFTYFASRGIEADGGERNFVARAWNRDRPDLCEPGPDGTPVCRSVEILLDAKQELQGGRLGTVTIGGTETAELVKGNVLHVPQHIPFLDSTVTVDAAAGTAPTGAKEVAGWSGLVDHTAAIAAESGGPRRYVYYGSDNRLLDVSPVEEGRDGGRAVKVAVEHWRLSKTLVCETRSPGDATQVCFKPEGLVDGAVRMVPTVRGGDIQRAVALPETRTRAVAED